MLGAESQPTIGVLGRPEGQAVGAALLVICIGEFVRVAVARRARQAIGMVKAHGTIDRMIGASTQHRDGDNRA
jgi:hypothetical protein